MIARRAGPSECDIVSVWEDPMSDQFFHFKTMTDAEYAALPPLVKKGQDRDDVISGIIEAWLKPTQATFTDDLSPRNRIEAHIEAGGFVLDGVALWDENTNEPIDLRDLLWGLEQRLLASGEPNAYRARPDLLIVLRHCRIDRCACSTLAIRPVFMAVACRFGDGADFEAAVFGQATDFEQSTFGNDVGFNGTTFGDRTSFNFAVFRDRAHFGGSHFGSLAWFMHANFGGRARFGGAVFGSGANFACARMDQGASFFNACFEGRAKFDYATLGSEADLSDASFGEMVLFSHTRLPDADLRNVSSFALDETFIRGARFSVRALDPWSQLRAAYTGPRLIFNLLFLILFFLPIVARTLGWITLGKAEQEVVAMIPELERRADELAATSPELGRWLRESIDAVERHLPGGEAERWRETRAWRAVLGVDRGWMVWLPAILLLLYNIGRGAMTFIVAPMRDAEERSGVTPKYAPPSWLEVQDDLARELNVTFNPPASLGGIRTGLRFTARFWRTCAGRYLSGYLGSYGWLVGPHQLLTSMYWLAVLSFVTSALYWLFLHPVWVPA